MPEKRSRGTSDKEDKMGEQNRNGGRKAGRGKGAAMRGNRRRGKNADA